MLITLYCAACQATHSFDDHEIEQLVYILQAEIAELIVAAPDDPFYADLRKEFHADPLSTICLGERLSSGTDQEMYGEVVESLVESRRELEGVEGCDNCGRDAPYTKDKVPKCDRCK